MPIRTTLIAAAIATAFVPASVAPARAADRDDIARILGGAAALAIIGSAVNAARDTDHDRDKRRVVIRDRDRDDHRFRDRDRRHHVRPGHRGRILRHESRRTLPARCLRRVETRHGRDARLLGTRCLLRNGVAAYRLPDACRQLVRLRGGVHQAYDARCLRKRGYRFRG
ncbi:hypothetical protein ROJ8625_03484 [Roseivivax jejudonensis]|uniref:Uncharacterized protein n=1 Tax=Roseivivax jejudonensis TaxID=1529041 RepID=A0A1X7A171_9RHOB|nr:hypothetical protein [Roseivivax jejudonensis]SLN67768.1 hypothetical protein ROJ8625_03484 [Roseivivax jejudonensis]